MSKNMESDELPDRLKNNFKIAQNRDHSCGELIDKAECRRLNEWYHVDGTATRELVDKTEYSRTAIYHHVRGDCRH